jgi:ABC-2 type transport system ATP-binding protein
MERFSLVPYAATRSGLLSGGWQQRLSLAVALVHRPELLVLDEPTVAVDVEARMDLWHLIEGLRDSGTTILLTSHHLAEAQRLCNRVALMRYGKVVAEGSVPELISRVPGKAVVKVQSEDNQAVIKRAFELGWSVRQHAGKISLLLPNNLNLREVVDALDGSKVNAISIDPVTLEDAYLELVGDSSSISLT